MEANSIQYRISTTGKSGYGEWLEIKNLENEEKINASVTVEFPEGVSNYIQWRARDVAGNKYKESPIYQIKVDSEPVTFSEPIPNPIRVLTSNTHLIGITITDKRSGVDSTKIFYSFSYDNKKSWSAWEPFDALDAASFKSNQVSGMTVLPASRSTFIKWLAYDIAGNQITSEPYHIQIDSAPKAIIDSPNQSYEYSVADLIHFDGRNSFDPDFEDVLTYSWESNVNGHLGTKSSLGVMLSMGNHTITLTVTDPYGLSDSTQINFSVLDITRPEGEDAKPSQTKDESTSSIILIGVNTALIIIFVLLLFLFLRKRKPRIRKKNN